MRLLSLLVVIIRVITTTLKCPDAVGEARMLQPPQKDASPGVEPPRTGFEISLTSFSRVRGDGGAEFNVEAPNQLRGTVADQGLDVTEDYRRREISREWEQLLAANRNCGCCHPRVGLSSPNNRT